MNTYKQLIHEKQYQMHTLMTTGHNTTKIVKVLDLNNRRQTWYRN